MDSPGYVVLSRLSAQLRATEVLAHNLANADTPGFQAQRTVFASHLVRQRDAAVPSGGGEVAYAEDRATYRDTTPGALQHTGNPLDVAITGDGLFAVETAAGERFTRSGRFSLGAEGRIVDMAGNAVLDPAGNPILVAANDTRVEIMGDGTVRSENGPLGRLRVVRFADPQALRAEGDRLFDAAGATPEDVARPGLVQGAVEGSNVSMIREMTRMTTELREFQFAAQFAEREDQRLQTAITTILGKH